MKDLSQAISDHTTQWDALKNSDVARKGDDLDVLLAMGHRELAQMAYTLFRCIEATDDYSYLISALEGHLEGAGNHQEGWVIAQADGGDNEGGFNKWCKTHGGDAYNGGPKGDALVFFRWRDAKRAYDHFIQTNPEAAREFLKGIMENKALSKSLRKGALENLKKAKRRG